MMFCFRVNGPNLRTESIPERNILFFTFLFLPPFNLILTRPGFAQSLGWIFVGSKSVSKPNRLHAFTISLASGFSTANSFPTMRPCFRLRLASKYTGYTHSKAAYLDWSSACMNCAPSGAVWTLEAPEGAGLEEEGTGLEGAEGRARRISRSSKSLSLMSEMLPSDGSLSEASSMRAWDIVGGLELRGRR